MSKEISRVDEIRSNLTKMTPQFKAALPSHISPDKFVRVAMTAFQTNPALLQADPRSLYGELMKSASDGLLCDGREAAMVTFNSKSGVVAKYMPMVAGVLKKVRQSGELLSLTAQVVYEKDKFRYFIDADGEHLEHEPNFFGDRGEVIGVYALAKTKDGGVYIEVLTTQEVMAIKNVSRAKDSGPWAGDFALEMYKKSAIRRLAKRLPTSTDLDTTIRRDDDLYEFQAPQKEVEQRQTKDVNEKQGDLKSKPKSKPSKLARAIKEQVEKEDPGPYAPDSMAGDPPQDVSEVTL